MPAGFDVEGAARRVADEPDLWTDGSLVDDKMSGVSSAGTGCFTFRVRRHWASWKWGHWDDDVGDGSVVSACRGFCSVPGLLQTVQRAELWGVKGHADEALVRAGTVRGLDKLGNDGADEAADFGRGRVPWWVIDARRNLSGVCSRWRPVVLVLHRFFIAISRAVVNHDDGTGTSIDPLVWSAGSAPSGFLPGPPDLWVGSWITVAVTPVFAVILKFGFFSVGMLVKWVAFLHSLHWPADGCDLGVGGVSFVELLILYEIWAGERIELEKAVLRYRRPGRSISVSAVPFGPGTDIWRSCRFIGALFRGLRDLPLGLRRFVPCDIGANHCRLRHIGWERCGHGLTSRPRESASEDFFNMLLVLFCYLDGSAAALLAGVLPLRYCSARFACKFSTWELPDKGHVCELVTDGVVGARVLDGDGICRVSLPRSVGPAGFGRD